MRHFLTITALLFFAIGLQAQTGKIRGKVADKGSGVAWSEVTLYDGLEKVAVMVADENGEFDFGQIQAGCYDIEATIGVVKVEQNICLTENTTYILNLYDGPPCKCCPAPQFVANPNWHGEVPRADLDLGGAQ